LKQEYVIRIRYVYFPLHPETPPAGQSLQALFGASEVEITAMVARLKALMDQEGLPFHPDRNMTYNSRLAQELAKWADARPEAEALHAALYRAYFVEGKNVGDMDVLLDAAGQAGLPVDEARRVLETRAMRQAVDDDWTRASRVGVTGVPTFVAGKYGIVGAQPYEQLARLAASAGAVSRQ